MGTDGKCENATRADNALERITDAIGILKEVMKSEQKQRSGPPSQQQVAADGYRQLRDNAQRKLDGSLRFPTLVEFGKVVELLLHGEVCRCARVARDRGYPDTATQIMKRNDY